MLHAQINNPIENQSIKFNDIKFPGFNHLAAETIAAFEKAYIICQLVDPGSGINFYFPNIRSAQLPADMLRRENKAQLIHKIISTAENSYTWGPFYYCYEYFFRSTEEMKNKLKTIISDCNIIYDVILQHKKQKGNGNVNYEASCMQSFKELRSGIEKVEKQIDSLPESEKIDREFKMAIKEKFTRVCRSNSLQVSNELKLSIDKRAELLYLQALIFNHQHRLSSIKQIRKLISDISLSPFDKENDLGINIRAGNFDGNKIPYYDYAREQAIFMFNKAYDICRLIKLEHIDRTHLSEDVYELLANMLTKGKDDLRVELFSTKLQLTISESLGADSAYPLIYGNEIFFRRPPYEKKSEYYWKTITLNFNAAIAYAVRIYFELDFTHTDHLDAFFTSAVKSATALNKMINELPETDTNEATKNAIREQVNQLLVIRDGIKIKLCKEEVQASYDLKQQKYEKVLASSFFKDLGLFNAKTAELLRLESRLEAYKECPPLLLSYNEFFKCVVFYKQLLDLIYLWCPTLKDKVRIQVSEFWNEQITSYQNFKLGRTSFFTFNDMSQENLQVLKSIERQFANEFQKFKDQLPPVVCKYLMVLINFHSLEMSFLYTGHEFKKRYLFIKKLSSLIKEDEIKKFYRQETSVFIVKDKYIDTRLQKLDNTIKDLRKFLLSNTQANSQAKQENDLSVKIPEDHPLAMQPVFPTTPMDLVDSQLANSVETIVQPAPAPVDQSTQENDLGLPDIPMSFDSSTMEEANQQQTIEDITEEETVDWEIVPEKKQNMIDLREIVRNIQLPPRKHLKLKEAVEAAIQLITESLRKAIKSHYSPDQKIDSAYLEEVIVAAKNKIRKYRSEIQHNGLGKRKEYQYEGEKEPKNTDGEIETTTHMGDELTTLFKTEFPKQQKRNDSPSTTKPESQQPENKKQKNATVGFVGALSPKYSGECAGKPAGGDWVLWRVMNEAKVDERQKLIDLAAKKEAKKKLAQLAAEKEQREKALAEEQRKGASTQTLFQPRAKEISKGEGAAAKKRNT